MGLFYRTGSTMFHQGVKFGYPNVTKVECTMKMSWLMWVFWPITHPLKTILMPGGITGRGIPSKDRKMASDENNKLPENGAQPGTKKE